MCLRVHRSRTNVAVLVAVLVSDRHMFLDLAFLTQYDILCHNATIWPCYAIHVRAGQGFAWARLGLVSVLWSINGVRAPFACPFLQLFLNPSDFFNPTPPARMRSPPVCVGGGVAVMAVGVE